ncbi:hypothetical protein [uncultured Lactobacillus sp.]|uniref:hypothetical protein n=1 Tax=uncultured Lactobacillus sp. TaxID=153152 RepID=UPI0023C8B3AC|nr:hypothetical protein [uncultured Lactobacillus sp.]MDE7056124.1 hypothetical protein [Lactobacillus sp.]
MIKKNVRSKKWYSALLPILTIFSLLILGLLLSAKSFSSITRIKHVNHNIEVQKKEINKLTYTYNNLKPNKRKESKLKFDLQGKQSALSNKYDDLMKTLFNNATPSFLTTKNLNKFKTLLGNSGIKIIRIQLLAHSIKNSNNINITFFDFNVDTKTIITNVSVKYSLDPDLNVNKEGAAFLKIKYNFNTNTGKLIELYMKDKDLE